MFAELHQLLFSQKQLSLPGIGSFVLERKPARMDFLNKCIHAPEYFISFDTSFHSASQKIFYKLATALNISETEAEVRFREFIYDLRKQIFEGKEIRWNGVGILSKTENAEIKFCQEKGFLATEIPIHAEKIIREHAKHIMRVGEQEMTSIEMEELLTPFLKIKRSRWWILPLTIFVLAVGFIAWYFYKNGLSVSSIGNQQKTFF